MTTTRFMCRDLHPDRSPFFTINTFVLPCFHLSSSFAFAMESLNANSLTDPLVLVKDNRVESVDSQQKRRSYQFFHFFLKALLSFVQCPEAGGIKHPRLALHLPSNQVYVFETCFGDTGEKAIYIPYVDRVSRPFRTAQVGDTVIKGINWLSSGVCAKGTPTPGCLFDALLVDLKVRTLAQKVCLGCLFTYSTGPGFLFENLIRTLIAHILVFAQPLGKSKYERIRVFTAEEDLKIRRVWFDKKRLCLVQEYDSSDGRLKERIRYSNEGI